MGWNVLFGQVLNPPCIGRGFATRFDAELHCLQYAMRKFSNPSGKVFLIVNTRPLCDTILALDNRFIMGFQVFEEGRA